MRSWNIIGLLFTTFFLRVAVDRLVHALYFGSRWGSFWLMSLGFVMMLGVHSIVSKEIRESSKTDPQNLYSNTKGAGL